MTSVSRRGVVGLGIGLALSDGRQAVAQSNEAATLRIQKIGGDASLKIANDAIARFRKTYPNVTVQVTLEPVANGWGEVVSNTFAQFATNRSYDIYDTAVETFTSFASRKLFLPLDDRFAAMPGKSDIDPNLVRYSKYKNVLYFVPYGWQSVMVNYNEDVFDDAHVPYPKPGWTWDDFLQTAKAVTKRDRSGNVLVYGAEFPAQFFMLQNWFASNDTSILNADWTGSNASDPKVKEVFQFMHDAIHVSKVAPIPQVEAMDNQFVAGQIAMITRGHWIVPTARLNKMRLAVARPPRKRTDATELGFLGYGISRQSKRPELAWALIEELLSTPSQTQELTIGMALPSRVSLASSPALLSYPDRANQYYPSLATARVVPSPTNFSEVSEIFVRNFTSMMADQVSVDQGVATLDSELKASFARQAAKDHT